MGYLSCCCFSCSPIFPFFHCIRKTYTTDSGRGWGCLIENLTNKGKNEESHWKQSRDHPISFLAKCLCIFGCGRLHFHVMKGRLTSWRPRVCSRAIDQGFYGDHQPLSCNTKLSQSVSWMLGSSLATSIHIWDEVFSVALLWIISSGEDTLLMYLSCFWKWLSCFHPI